jgi:hypothetical protein
VPLFGENPGDELEEISVCPLAESVDRLLSVSSLGVPVGTSIPWEARKLRTPARRGLPSTNPR